MAKIPGGRNPGDFFMRSASGFATPLHHFTIIMHRAVNHRAILWCDDL
jgi:hypothetical protein